MYFPSRSKYHTQREIINCVITQSSQSSKNKSLKSKALKLAGLHWLKMKLPSYFFIFLGLKIFVIVLESIKLNAAINETVIVIYEHSSSFE